MAVIEDIPQTYDEAVRTLAHWHAEDQTPPVLVYLFPDPASETVRFVEVSEGFPETGAAVPVAFGRSAEFPFRSAVILATPAEWQQIISGKLALPAGWTLERRKQVWPNDRG